MAGDSSNKGFAFNRLPDNVKRRIVSASLPSSSLHEEIVNGNWNYTPEESVRSLRLVSRAMNRLVLDALGCDLAEIQPSADGSIRHELTQRIDASRYCLHTINMFLPVAVVTDRWPPRPLPQPTRPPQPVPLPIRFLVCEVQPGHHINYADDRLHRRIVSKPLQYDLPLQRLPILRQLVVTCSHARHDRALANLIRHGRPMRFQYIVDQEVVNWKHCTHAEIREATGAAATAENTYGLIVDIHFSSPTHDALAPWKELEDENSVMRPRNKPRQPPASYAWAFVRDTVNRAKTSEEETLTVRSLPESLLL